MKMFYLCSIILWFGGMMLQAQENLQVKFRSRALFDAAVSGYGKESAQGYYRLEDFRVGFKAVYGKYEIKADIGLGGGKVALKDLLLNYRFKNSLLSLGNGYEPFSMDMLISTADMRLNQSAASVLAYTNSRKLGATYYVHLPNWLLITGVYTHNDINKLGDNPKNAWVSTSRVIWRKSNQSAETLLHIGAAFSFRTQEVNTDLPPRTKVSSSGITSMLPFPLLEAEVPDMGTELKGLLEVLYTAPKFMLQAEYFYNRLNRTEGGIAYQPHGGYIQGSYLLRGKGFEYDDVCGIPGRPSAAQAIELVGRFNYTDMNDDKAQIYGGCEKDISLGVNFYLNRFIGIKINGSYVWVGKGCHEFYSKDLFWLQARLQYIF